MEESNWLESLGDKIDETLDYLPTPQSINQEIINTSSKMIADQYGEKIKTAAIVGSSALVLILILLSYDVYLNLRD